MVHVRRDIAAALAAGRPVVALESSVLAQGLPIPQNAQAAQQMTAAVERAGAIGAVTAIVRGEATIGLEREDLERFLRRDGIRKVSARDIPAAITRGLDGATTVAASLVLARMAGIAVFATGGIGGVHRDSPFDESADLAELARTPVIVVCAGPKAILDVPATWERLETLGVPVVGYRTRELPAFFTAETGIALETYADTAHEIVEIYRAHCGLGRSQSVVVVQSPPAADALPRGSVDAAVAEAQAEARKAGISGAGVTPYMLDAVSRLMTGGSLTTNLALLEQNAGLAGEIATICAERQ